MTLFLQIASAGLIVAAAIAWTAWVRDSYRTITSPEHLAPIQVHGLDGEAGTLAEALAIGVMAELAEHKRVVSFVNRAARLDAEGATALTPNLMRVSDATPPALIRHLEAPDNLDLSLQFAGTRVETSGLRALFSPSERRGGLGLSLILRDAGDGTLAGRVSAEFTENPAFGFTLDAAGTVEDIAQLIAMRYVQASYAEADPFLTALPPRDFRALWHARRRAADVSQLARGSGSSTDDAAAAVRPVVLEATRIYAEKKAIFKRYRARPEIQRLAAYLASAAEEFEDAIWHLNAVLEVLAPEDAEHAAITAMIAALSADLATEEELLIRAAPTGGQSLADLEETLRAQPQLGAAGITALAERAASEAALRPARVAVILGGLGREEIPGFEGRIVPAGPGDIGPAGSSWAAHTEEVATLVATLAPGGDIRVYRALDDTGGAPTSNIVSALNRAASDGADIILLPLGSTQLAESRVFGGALDLVSRAGALVVMAAGNNGAEPRLPPSALPGVLYAGAWDGEERAAYSNFGADVALFAPGASLVIANGALSEMRGTVVSAAIAAAVAANLLQRAPDDLAGADLAAAVLAQTRPAGPEDTARVLAVTGTD